jgi:hypothetical protein
MAIIPIHFYQFYITDGISDGNVSNLAWLLRKVTVKNKLEFDLVFI